MGWISTAGAHQASDAFLSIALESTPADSIRTRWDIALRDLDAQMDLDRDRDGRLSWGEIRERRPAIIELANDALTFALGGVACTPGRSELSLARRGEGVYAVLDTVHRCAGGGGQAGQAGEPVPLVVRYALFRGLDPGHRAILTSAGETRVLANDGQPAALTVAIGRRPGRPDASGARTSPFASFVANGMHHILIGWDHLAFLALLVMPSVLVRRAGHWHPAADWRGSLRALLVTVTAFTLSHSISLSLAVLDVVVPPPWLIEPLIALSIVAAAAMNLWPREAVRPWRVAFGFGFIHGFGFAGALAEADVTGSGLALALAGFNLGVELGQLAFITLIWLPLWLVRSSRTWQHRAVPAGSMAMGALGIGWFIQRVIDLT